MSAIELLATELISRILDHLFAASQRSRTCALSLSSTSKTLRAKTVRWTFWDVSNLGRKGTSMWPESLWPHFRKVSLWDHLDALHRAASLEILPSSASQASLSQMPSLSQLVVYFRTTLSYSFLERIAALDSLVHLELHYIRLDGPIPASLSFRSLTSLVLRISGPLRTRRQLDINRTEETRNLMAFLGSLSTKLIRLEISGDLLVSQFGDIRWKCLKHFTITDHPPLPSIPLTRLIGNMRRVVELQLHYTADVPHHRLPPFRLDVGADSDVFSCLPELESCSFSNLDHEDAVFRQLPPNLTALKLQALHDVPAGPYRSARPQWYLGPLGDYPLSTKHAHAVLQALPPFGSLTTLSIAGALHIPGRCFGPPVLESILERAPNLVSLELVHRPEYEQFNLIDFSGYSELLFDWFRQLRRLAHLRICIVMEAMEFYPGPPVYAAYCLFEHVPTLRTVTYRFEGYWNTRHPYGLGRPVVDAWDRSLLALPRPARVIRPGQLIM
ncbi:hypothetical protein MIND_00655900 [Mycena indigotica]|uniref:F-box domain-containing protein n=1 Tax=Mycena indigotica TaxID=2126181 RepID=A0A8H6SLC8_9AGAR|nr:uncharacterized protein MIND_00655900 [Mycena indigotica]KAF7300930.1 hypothetical protein MIND_00655900 [Mycena indigotica]